MYIRYVSSIKMNNMTTNIKNMIKVIVKFVYSERAYFDFKTFPLCYIL